MKGKKKVVLLAAVMGIVAVSAAAFLLFGDRNGRQGSEPATESMRAPTPETAETEERSSEKVISSERMTELEETETEEISTEAGIETEMSYEDYIKCNKENIAREEYIKNFYPDITGFSQEPGHVFPFDQEAIRQSAGWYLYSTFGDVEITRIRFDYFLAEWDGGISYHVTMIEPDGEETPMVCTYYSNEIGKAYNYRLAEE